MKYWKSWLEKVKDPSLDPYERRYRLLSLIMTLVLVPWMISSLIMGVNGMRVVVFALAGIIFFVSAQVALKIGKARQDAVLNVLIVVFLLIPWAFTMMGGARSGAPYWCLLAMLYTLSTVKGRLGYVLIAVDVLVTLGCYLFTYLHPERVITLTDEAFYLNSLTQLTGNIVVCGSMFLFQLYMARQERDILKAQRDEIGELNRSQNRFFSAMSHEIRTPINTIIGLNEMNMREQDLSDEVYANNRHIQGASNMLLSLINDVLDMSKMESGKMDIVPVVYDTKTMLTEIVNMVWERAKSKGLHFTVDVDPSLPVQLYADEVRIRQVLINLLNNAVKYTKEGSIRLQVLCDRTGDSNARVTYRVEDTGMGIKKEAIPDLFDAFKRVDQEANRNIEGTGLGLSIVKQIVDLMHGEITVDSIYTKGSTFSVSFTQEIVDDTEIGEWDFSVSRTVANREVYLQRFEAPTASLLIVDDNELNLQVEAGLLKATRMQIDTARSGKECLSMTFRKKYDVIFMDHLMPEMDGIETLKEIRSQRGGLNRDTKVLVLTANAGSENQALYAREGFDGYLVKPVTGEQLEDAMLSALPREKVNLTGTATVRAERETITGQHRRSRYIAVSCESGADLPEALLKQYRIEMINSLIRTEESVFYDNLDIESDGLLDYLDMQDKHAYSEPPAVEAYERFYAEALSRAQYVVHISLGSGVAREFAHATEAASSFDRVHVVDSGNFSAGTGMLVLYAAHLAEQSDDINRFLADVERMKQRIRSTFIVDATELLARGGRIPGVLHSWMKAMMLHPVLKMKKQALSLSTVYLGERGGYRKRYIRHALREGGAIDDSLLIVVYAGVPEEELKMLRDTVEEERSFKRILFVKTSGAIAVNSGRGSFALVYCARTDIGSNGLFDFLPADIGEEKDAGSLQRGDGEEGHGADGAHVLPHPEAASPLQKLYQEAPALHYADAKEYLGKEELMEKSLRTFYENSGKNAAELDALLQEDDFENFTIKVHALKSSARLIGAPELSALAEKLEEYGNFIRS